MGLTQAAKWNSETATQFCGVHYNKKNRDMRPRKGSHVGSAKGKEMHLALESSR